MMVSATHLCHEVMEEQLLSHENGEKDSWMQLETSFAHPGHQHLKDGVDLDNNDNLPCSITKTGSVVAKMPIQENET